MKDFYFERLQVWQESRLLVKDMYAVSDSFPSEEKFGLTSQLRTATLSISANIAEGICRATEKDKARFINKAFSSAIEVINFLILAKDLEFLTQEEYLKFRNSLKKITDKLNSLHKKFNKLISKYADSPV